MSRIETSEGLSGPRVRYGRCVVSSELLGNGVNVVSVAGEIDLHTATLLRQALAAALEPDSARLVVDLAECGFVDSTAVATLLEANARLNQRNRRLALIAPRREVRRAIELMGLHNVFALHDSRASALGRADG